MSSILRRYSFVLALALPLAGLTGCFDDDDPIQPITEVEEVDVTTEVSSDNGAVLPALGIAQFDSGEFLAPSLAGTALTMTFDSETELTLATADGSAQYNYTISSIILGTRISFTGTFPDDSELEKELLAQIKIVANDLTIGEEGQATVTLIIDGVESDPVVVDVIIESTGGNQVTIEIAGVEVVEGEVGSGGDFTGTGSGS